MRARPGPAVVKVIGDRRFVADRNNDRVLAFEGNR
jgi:hypothetical protein